MTKIIILLLNLIYQINLVTSACAGNKEPVYIDILSTFEMQQIFQISQTARPMLDTTVMRERAAWVVQLAKMMVLV